MYKKTITYTDFNGNEKTKDFYFNLTRPELMEMKRSPLVTMQAELDRIRNMENPDEELTLEEKDQIQEHMGDILRNLVIKSYGVKSLDGERFTKRIGDRQFGQGEDFVDSMAYDVLYVEMISDLKNLINFVRAIIPANLQEEFDSNPEIQEGIKMLESNPQ